MKAEPLTKDHWLTGFDSARPYGSLPVQTICSCKRHCTSPYFADADVTRRNAATESLPVCARNRSERGWEHEEDERDRMMSQTGILITHCLVLLQALDRRASTQ